jgi:DNA-binding CsgD family transcriptional regulator
VKTLCYNTNLIYIGGAAHVLPTLLRSLLGRGGLRRAESSETFDEWRTWAEHPANATAARLFAGSIGEVGAITMRRRQLKSPIGVLLLDAQLRLVHHTVEAANILEYPRKPRESVALDKVLPAIRSQIAGPSKAAAASSRQFTSGRRRYECRAFLLDSTGHTARGDVDRPQPKIVVVLERVFPQAPDVTRWCEAFLLTNREAETVKLLLKGLTSKEIADQMNISPSTVKSFLKLIMTKVGASNRMGIIAKILREGIGS